MRDMYRQNLDEVPAVSAADSGKYGAFGASVRGDTGLITLENNKIELKISPKGGRVYSAGLKISEHMIPFH